MAPCHDASETLPAARSRPRANGSAAAADLVPTTRPRRCPGARRAIPYRILVSEVMLQQTQVDRVLPKYHEWLDRYPTFEALADAPERDVVAPGTRSATTSGPGGCTRSRARPSTSYGGQLPGDEATLRSFKGIGAYTAGAVMSFAFGKRAAILDTNVARVLFRVFVGKGDAQTPRDEEAPVGHLAGGAAASPRLRLQSGADGFRRDGLLGARRRAVRSCPMTIEVPRVPVQPTRGTRVRSGRR